MDVCGIPLFSTRPHRKLWTGYDFIWIVTMTDAIRKDFVLHFYQEFYTVLYSQNIAISLGSFPCDKGIPRVLGQYKTYRSGSTFFVVVMK